MLSGIPYFPLDVRMDDKFRLIEAEFGITGFGVIVKILQQIYGMEGYYIEWTEEVALLFSRDIGMGVGAVSEIVAASIRRGIFHKELYEKYGVLTSKGIQQRYFEAVKRRKTVAVKDHLLLVSVTQTPENVNIKRKNGCNSFKNADIFKQRKEEENKGKERRGEERNAQALHNGSIAHAIQIYESNMGSINTTSSVMSSIGDWCEKAGSELVIACIEDVAKGGKKPWSYIEKRLMDWYGQGLKTKGDVEAYLSSSYRSTQTTKGAQARNFSQRSTQPGDLFEVF